MLGLGESLRCVFYLSSSVTLIVFADDVYSILSAWNARVLCVSVVEAPVSDCGWGVGQRMLRFLSGVGLRLRLLSSMVFYFYILFLSRTF